MINLVLGTWWTVSLLGSLLFAVCKSCYQNISDGEHFLVSIDNRPLNRIQVSISLQQLDGASPVGFRVPSLPRFEVDEKLFVSRGHQTVSSKADFTSAVFVVIMIAAIMGIVSSTKFGKSIT